MNRAVRTRTRRQPRPKRPIRWGRDARLAPQSARRHQAATAGATPVILVATSDHAGRRALAPALQRRFGADYHILAVTGTKRSLAALDRLGDEGADVALVFADFRLPATVGVEFLAAVRRRHPRAKRILLTTVGDRVASEPLHRAMTLGQIDLFIEQPWCSPEEWLYPQVSEALAAWWRVNRPRFERVRIVGEQWDARSHELRDLGTRNVVPFGFYPTNTEPGRRLLDQLGLDASRLPIVALSDGRVLVDPTNAEIATALGVPTQPPAGTFDVTVVGAGPAGLAAAVYAASEGLRTVIVEPEALGGQAASSSMIRNYLGFPHGIGGEELTRRAYDQALYFGAHFVHTRAATALRAEGGHRVVTLSDGSEVVSRTVVLAMGVAYQRLGVPALERLVGSGVFYGAATAEARSLRGVEVFVVGAGNSAGQAALHLAEHAARVTLLVRGDSLAASMSAYLIDQLHLMPNIGVRLSTRISDGAGDHRLEALVLEDTTTGRTERVAAAALFVLIGGTPRTDWLDGTVERDESGYVLACRDLAPEYQPRSALWPREDRLPFALETSLPGVFAVGDVRHNSVKRVASAVGAGAMAIASAHAYLAEQMAEQR